MGAMPLKGNRIRLPGGGWAVMHNQQLKEPKKEVTPMAPCTGLSDAQTETDKEKKKRLREVEEVVRYE